MNAVVVRGGVDNETFHYDVLLKYYVQNYRFLKLETHLYVSKTGSVVEKLEFEFFMYCTALNN